MTLQISNKKTDGQECHHKSDDASDYKKGHIVFHKNFRICLVYVIATFHGSSQHGRNGQEKGKFSGCTPVKLLLQSTDNSSSTTAQARKQNGENLVTTNQECVFICDLVLRMYLGFGKQLVNKQ